MTVYLLEMLAHLKTEYKMPKNKTEVLKYILDLMSIGTRKLFVR